VGTSYNAPSEEELQREFETERNQEDWVDALHMTASSSGRYPWDEESLQGAAKMWYRLIKQGPGMTTVSIPRKLLWDLRECARLSGASNEIRDAANKALGVSDGDTLY
jgi:hypothetical protein